MARQPIQLTESIHRELLNWGIEVAQSRVAKYSSPPREATLAELANIPDESREEDGLDRLLTVPTLTSRVLFVCVVLSLAQRPRVVHIGVTEHPTQEWTVRLLGSIRPESLDHVVVGT